MRFERREWKGDERHGERNEKRETWSSEYASTQSSASGADVCCERACVAVLVSGMKE